MRTSRLGQCVRSARQQAGLRLRDVAERLGVTVPYVCDIELGRRVPSQQVLERLARVLHLDPEELMDLACRLGPEVEQYLREHPRAVRLLRMVAQLHLTDSELENLERSLASFRSGRREKVAPG